MFGTILTCSSSSWITAWIGLEINLIRFIPLLLVKLNSTNSENAIKYFLVQAIASILIIAIILINLNTNNSFLSNSRIDIITISLALKAGVAPLHFWFPQIIINLSWLQACLLLTWQKIAPLILLSFNFNWVINLLIIFSALIGSIIGLNQINLIKLLAFSSIINAAWLISVSFIRIRNWWIYFIIYSIIVLSILFTFKYLNFKNLTDSLKIKTNYVINFLIFINILSLAGIPPFVGFFIKIIIIDLIINSLLSITIIIILLLSAIISFYFYLRLIYFILIINSKTNFINVYHNNLFITITIILIISLSTNLIFPFFILLY